MNRLPFFFRPYIEHEFPGWGKLFSVLNIGGINNTNEAWRVAPTVTTRGKRHRYLMELDLSDDLERATYFLRRYYDLEIQLLLDALLKPGDTFVDVGANIGMTTLHAARLVAEGGKVISFEPQPQCCSKIAHNLDLNDIRHVKIHNVGLASNDSELTLLVPAGASILATFAAGDDANQTSNSIKVAVRRGDDVLSGQLIGKPTIKIDVEGFELEVIQGLVGTIDKYRHSNNLRNDHR